VHEPLSRQTRPVLLVLLSPDIATGTADVTSGVADSDVRASETRCIVFACSGLEPTQMCSSFYILALRNPPPPPLFGDENLYNSSSVSREVETKFCLN
jgi:hypothetical protein